MKMRKPAKTLLSLLAAAVLCLSLSACSLSVFDAKSLMSPPRVNEDQQAIYTLLRGDRPELEFVYPTAGEYRSAILMRDFTGDGQQDAIGFTATEDNAGVEVRFLTKNGERWETISSFRSAALQVDRVLFGRLTGSPRDSVVIGWGSTAGATGRTASASCYVYNGETVEESPLGNYAEIVLTDMDGNGVEEVFTVDKFLPAENEGEAPAPATARLYAWSSGEIRELCSTAADNLISSYSQALFGRLSDDLRGVVLDGAQADGNLTTQIFLLENGALYNFPVAVNTEEYFNPYARPTAILCRDINGDGFLDLPKLRRLRALPEDTVPDSTGYLVEWSAFSTDNRGRLVARTLMNLPENYCFQISYQLTGNITALNDPELRTVTYHAVDTDPDSGEKTLGEPLFALRVFTRSSWEDPEESRDYELLTEGAGDLRYAIRVYTRDEDMLRQLENVWRSFRLLSE